MTTRLLTTPVLCLWQHMPTGSTPEHPSVVLRPQMADPRTGVICLAQLDFAYCATAASFSPGEDWTGATLYETSGLDGAGLDLRQAGIIDLFRVGWASRAGAIRFSR